VIPLQVAGSDIAVLAADYGPNAVILAVLWYRTRQIDEHVQDVEDHVGDLREETAANAARIDATHSARRYRTDGETADD